MSTQSPQEVNEYNREQRKRAAAHYRAEAELAQLPGLCEALAEALELAVLKLEDISSQSASGFADYAEACRRLRCPWEGTIEQARSALTAYEAARKQGEA